MRVFLHTGAGKTGTSAIQVALAKSRGKLADAGIHYPVGLGNSDAMASQGKISSGNAPILGPWLNPKQRRPDFDKTVVDRWLQTCIAEAAGRDLLFSSEMMQFPRAEEAAELCSLFSAAGYRPTIIFYVRHVIDQAIAAYLQHLKRGFEGMPDRGTINSMSDFLQTYRCTYLYSLLPFANILPPEQIIVRLYEGEAPGLIPGFLKLVTDRSIEVPETTPIINRSPVLAEREVFLALGKQPNGPFLCQLAGDLMLNRAAPPEPHRITAADLAAFSARNQDVVDQINARFLRGHGTLLMKSNKIEIGDIPQADPKRVYEAFAECFALLAKARNLPRE